MQKERKVRKKCGRASAGQRRNLAERGSLAGDLGGDAEVQKYRFMPSGPCMKKEESPGRLTWGVFS